MLSSLNKLQQIPSPYINLVFKPLIKLTIDTKYYKTPLPVMLFNDIDIIKYTLIQNQDGILLF